MKIGILAGVAALALGVIAGPASAHDPCRDGYYGGSNGNYGNYSGYGSYGANNGYGRTGYGSNSGYGGYNGYGYSNSRDTRHARDDSRLEQQHEWAHQRGIYSEGEHERLHKKLDGKHDVIHHHAYGTHSPEHLNRNQNRGYYDSGYGY